MWRSSGATDRDIWSDHFAYRRQEWPFAVVVVFERHRAVDTEEDAIDGHCGANALDDLIAHQFESLLG